MSTCLTVARKELRDHSRDVRSLATTASLALMGPAIVLLISRSPVAAGPRGRFVLLAMASVFTLVAAVTGAMNVAMDATAGERERRSLVPLRLCPVSPFELAVGKWLAACAFALGGLVLTVAAFVAALGAVTVGGLIGSMLVALVPLALLASAVHLLLASLCRTTKEAHAWLSGLVFVPMAAGMFVVFFPGALDGWTSLLPVVGQQRLLSQAIGGEAGSVRDDVLLAAVTLGAAFPALLGTGRALGRDDFLAAVSLMVSVGYGPFSDLVPGIATALS